MSVCSFHLKLTSARFHECILLSFSSTWTHSYANSSSQDAGPHSMTQGTPSSGQCPGADAEAAADAAEENLRCRLCKLTIELDRASAAREAGYKSGLYSMLHADKMAKHDIIVGVPAERSCWAALHSIFE